MVVAVGTIGADLLPPPVHVPAPIGWARVDPPPGGDDTAHHCAIPIATVEESLRRR